MNNFNMAHLYGVQRRMSLPRFGNMVLVKIPITYILTSLYSNLSGISGLVNAGRV